MEAARIVVGGHSYRAQTATKEMRCDACPDPILPGMQYVRVMEGVVGKEKETDRRPMRETKDAKLERFHTHCFTDEFTNAPG